MIKLQNNKFFQYEIIGEFHSDGEWIHPARTIDSYELIFVLSGTVFLEEDGVCYELSPNSIFLLEPGKFHKGFQKNTSDVSFYWLHFYTDIDIPHKLYCKKDYHDIKFLMKKLLHISNSDSCQKQEADSLALVILQEFLRICNPQPAENNALLSKICEYIRINLKNGVTVSQIADHFGYNPDYIGKLFKKKLCVGLKEYIATEKVNCAKDLLLTTSMSVKEISYELGFSSENLFIKFFVYHENLSPAKFRNQYCNTHMNNK